MWWQPVSKTSRCQAAGTCQICGSIGTYGTSNGLWWHGGGPVCRWSGSPVADQWPEWNDHCAAHRSDGDPTGATSLWPDRPNRLDVIPTFIDMKRDPIVAQLTEWLRDTTGTAPPPVYPAVGVVDDRRGGFPSINLSFATQRLWMMWFSFFLYLFLNIQFARSGSCTNLLYMHVGCSTKSTVNIMYCWCTNLLLV